MTNWSLAHPEVVYVPCSRTIEHLSGARAFLISLCEADQQLAKWQHLAGQLLACAETGDPVVIDLFRGSLEHALWHPPFPRAVIDTQRIMQDTQRIIRR
jgi:hypothetical protein